MRVRGIAPGDEEAFFAPPVLPPVPEDSALEAAVDIILTAVDDGLRISIFGDYDCDGICATAILYHFLKNCAGADVDYCIPDRFGEGYGITPAAVERMCEQGTGLIVTVDNGISAIDAANRADELGLAMVITDHHLAGEELPKCGALVDPHLPDSGFGYRNECGAGVAFMLANALVTKARKRALYSGPNVGGPLLVLAGLATVTDIMPIVGQNRILVSEALRRFRTLAPAGLKELYARAARSAVQPLTSRDFGFLIGPRINAAGRMATAMDALRLILSTDREKCRAYAQIVDIRNIERKNIEQTMLDEALSKIVPGAPAQVIDLPDGHQGVAGIVASRILERLVDDPSSGGPRPVCVVVAGHGSARAPEGYNVREAFLHAADTLERFGGHAAAGGFSVKPGEVDRFRELFCEGCAKQLVDRPPETCGASYLDAWIEPSDLTLEFAEAVQRLEPFGEGNPAPLFLLRECVVRSKKALKDGK